MGSTDDRKYRKHRKHRKDRKDWKYQKDRKARKDFAERTLNPEARRKEAEGVVLTLRRSSKSSRGKPSSQKEVGQSWGARNVK